MHARVLAECGAITAGVVGVRLEVKPASVAVHVRQASREDAARVVTAVLDGPGRGDGVRVLHGKEVVELAVVDADKGRAVVALRTRAHATATLFVGDDVTDEAAFAALTSDDVGVKVGDGGTAAGFRVPTPRRRGRPAVPVGAGAAAHGSVGRPSGRTSDAGRSRLRDHGAGVVPVRARS